MYTNADQLLNKRGEFELRIKNRNPHIIGVTEVKPKNGKDVLPSEFNIDGYRLFHSFDTCPEGRGTLLYVKSFLDPKEAYFTSNFKEGVFAEISLNNNDVLLISVLYRSEKGGYSGQENNEGLNDLLTEIKEKKYSHILGMGDINYPLIDWDAWLAPGDDTRETKFLKCLEDNFYFQHVDKPTRIRGTDKPNILDLIITNDNNVSDLEYESPLGKSDHRVMFFNLNCYAVLSKVDRAGFLYHKADWDSIQKECDKIDWRDILSTNGDDIDSMWDTFVSKVQELHKRHVPIRKYQIQGHKGKFPVDESTRELISQKHALDRKKFCNNTEENRRAFNRIRNKVQREVNKIKKSFERDLAKRAKKNPKDVYRYLKSKQKVQVGIGDLHVNPSDLKSRLTDNDKEKAEIFSDFYQSVFTIEPEGDIPMLPDREVLRQMPKLIITESKIAKVLSKLKPDKSPGPDGLHPRFFKEMAKYMNVPLCIIFNLSLSGGVLPAKWKKARVSAIYKKENKKVASNYRPVSLTSIICKVMETLIRDHIVEHMKINNLFSDKQYGFISGRSTSLQLLTVLDIWTDALERGLTLDIIYMDFRKAFDVVPHRRLVGKLKSYGISKEITNWVVSFLSNRFQTVTVNGAESAERPVLSGIPQGSVLGPMLFVIYINDLPESVLGDPLSFLFADDTKLFNRINCVDDCFKLLEEIDNLYEWSQIWLIGFNSDKCKHMHIGNRDYVFTYDLNGAPLDYTDVEKDIGVHIDDQLSFDAHISKKCKKANSMFAFIRRTFKFLDMGMFLPLYKAIVRSHLDSCSSVWSPYDVKHIKSIENVQRRATKQIPGFRDLSYAQRLRKLKLPTLLYRRVRGDLIETYKILNDNNNLNNGRYDNTTVKFLTKWRDLGVRISPRNNQLALLPQKANKCVRLNSFSVRVVKWWNNLTDHEVLSPNVNTFKNRIDKFFHGKDIVYDFDNYMDRIRYT